MSQHELLAKLESLLAASPIGIAFLDRDLRFQQINEALASIYGRSVAEHIGKTIDEVVPDIAPAVRPQLEHALSTGEAVLGLELAGRPASSPERTRHFLANYFPVRSADEVLGVGAVVLEITERKHMEDELRRLATQREHVLAVVSHDLRSPLAAIELTTRLLRTHCGTDARARQHLDVIERSALRMERLTEDLADSAAIRRGQLSLRIAIELVDDVVAECIVTNQVLAAEKHVELVHVGALPGVAIECDRRRVLQVLTNLIGNAIKACRQGDEITLSARDAGADVELCVRDTGPGIAPDLLATLFDPDRSTTRRGLGLFICRGIVTAHGGRIWATSTPGEGASVCFTLPRR